MADREQIDRLLDTLSPEASYVVSSAKVEGIGYPELAEDLGKSVENEHAPPGVREGVRSGILATIQDDGCHPRLTCLAWGPVLVFAAMPARSSLCSIRVDTRVKRRDFQAP